MELTLKTQLNEPTSQRSANGLFYVCLRTKSLVFPL